MRFNSLASRPFILLVISIVLLSLTAIAQTPTVESGVVLMGKGNFAEAKSAFETILKSDKNNADAHYRLAQVFLTSKFSDEESAIEHLESAIEINPTNADYAFAMGQAYGMKTSKASILKQPFLAPKVKSWFEKTIELNPKHLGGHVGVAQYCSQAPSIMGGDMARAWKEVDIVRSLDRYQGTMLKANLLRREKKFADAEAEYKSYCAANPNDWRGWKNLGYYYLGQKQTDASIEAFDKYVAVKPDTADAYDSLGEALLAKRDYDKAIAAFKTALYHDKNTITSIDQLAQSYEGKGMKKEARETYQWYASVEKDDAKRNKAEEKIKMLQ